MTGAGSRLRVYASVGAPLEKEIEKPGKLRLFLSLIFTPLLCAVYEGPASC